LQRFAGRQLDVLPVVADDRLVGVLTVHAIQHYLRIRHASMRVERGNEGGPVRQAV
jgi:hypothetical protein